MLKIRTALALAVPGCLALLATAGFLAPARATQEQVSLMQTIEEWRYPGSTQLGGASMSDGGNPEIPDLTCKANLTTPDPIQDVIRFYVGKVGDVPAKAVESQAVVTQDDSKDRPVTLRIISVHKASASNTIVISRGEGEKLTHIAWSQYRRLPSRH
jgi:hypothetical protein